MRVLCATAFKPFGVDDQDTRQAALPEVFCDRLPLAHGLFFYRGDFPRVGRARDRGKDFCPLREA